MMEGLMWRAINADGTLTYTFVESVKAKTPYYVIRMLGGLLYLIGTSIMLWNVLKTASSGKAAVVTIPPVAAHA
jgi:cytochrome c oxidase cbb3-type subunit 1